MRGLTALLTLGLLCGPAMAAPEARPIQWSTDGADYSGYIVHDPSVEEDLPGLVMVPNWMGVREEAVEQARRIAREGYVVLVADMYGSGIRPANTEEAGAAARAVYADRPALRGRINAALDALRQQAGEVGVDTDRLAAVGFCFGGTVVLELARSGAQIGGVVSFHGNLGTTMPARTGQVATPMLVLNGADDPMVDADQIQGFQEEMTAAGADWQFVNFSGAVHCFAEPGADGGPACQYDQRTAERAFRMMHGFLAEAFAD